MPIYRREDDDEEQIDLNEELETLPDTASTEEKTYFKRYGDLRRYMQSVVDRLNAQINTLTNQVNNGASIITPDPNDDAAIDEWISEHPEIAKIVMGVADRRAVAATSGLDERIKNQEERERTFAIQSAQQKLAEAHPDFFDEIRTDPKFLDWLDSKSPRTQASLRENDTDWKAASDVISLYKTEVLNESKPKSKTRNNNADFVPTRNTSQPREGRQGKFSESQIQKMTSHEYEAQEEAINEAWRKGEVVRDISGGAR